MTSGRRRNLPRWRRWSRSAPRRCRRRRSPIPAGRSRWSFRCRRAAPTTSWRASSPTSSAPSLGQQVVVENRAAGGSGTVGTRQVAHGTAPDGYTILLGYTSTLATGPSLFRNVGYDPRKDFAPIGLIASAPALLLVHPSLPVRNVKDLIALMQASSEPFQLGTPGIGTVNHLAAVLFAQQAGVKLQMIPYKGSNALTTDLIGGHVKVGFNPIPVSRGALEGGLIRALAGTSLEALEPRCRTCRRVAESGLPGFDAVAELRAGRAGRHAAADHRPAQQGARRGARDRGGAASASPRRAPSPMPTTPEEHAARHRSRGNQMVDADQVGRPAGAIGRFAMIMMQSALRAISLARCATRRARRSRRAGLSQPPDHADRSLRGRRRQRRHGAHRRREDEQDARPADRDREPRRRRRHHRHPRRSPRPRPTATRSASAAPARSPSIRRSTAMSATTRARISRRSA